MGDIVEFPNPNAPDADCVWVDPQGVEWLKFAIAFTDGEREYAFNIWARDFDHAEQCSKSIRATAELKGQVLAQVPA